MSMKKISIIVGGLLSLLAGVFGGSIIGNIGGIVFGAVLTFGTSVFWILLVYALSIKTYKKDNRRRYLILVMICSLVTAYSSIIGMASSTRYLQLPFEVSLILSIFVVLGLWGVIYFTHKVDNEDDDN